MCPLVCKSNIAGMICVRFTALGRELSVPLF